ncbi:MAG: alpha/beta hydrolase [Oscillospiraceae bacterium]|jgi:acetyl esterase/lipase|nr:alpha/beta hydrolase [Oscillospiraceae bacterium]
MISQQAKDIRDTLLKNKNLDELLNTPLEVKRKGWEEFASNDIIPDGIVIEKAVINNLPAEWISTVNSSKDNMILYFHGGGHTQGSIVTHRKLAAHIAKNTEVPVCIFEYPLAPEYPYPAALNSSEGVYAYLLDHGYKADNIVLGGDSSGGGLAIALTLLLKDKEIPFPKGIFLLSPMLDYTLSGDTMKTCAEKDPLCFEEDLRIDASYYIQNESPFNPLISPVYGDIRGFPPLLIQAGSEEILLSDATRFADKAKTSQVDVELSVWEGMWHVFQGWVGEIPEAADAIEKIGRFTKALFH